MILTLELKMSLKATTTKLDYISHYDIIVVRFIRVFRMKSNDFLKNLNEMRLKIGKRAVRNNDFSNCISNNFSELKPEIEISKNGMKMSFYDLSEKQMEMLEESYLGKMCSYASKERACIQGIEAALGRKIEKQFIVAGYRCDAYDKEENCVYEIHENHHKFKKETDKKRRNKIIAEINCRFIEIDV
jgi:hypothetical protein